MTTVFPEPSGDTADPAELMIRYLDFFRHTVLRKVGSLPNSAQRTARLPSGWTPVEMVSHLVHVERRWLVWGFLGEQVSDPWGDTQDDRWHVADDVDLDDLAAAMHAGGRRTTEVLRTHPLEEIAPPGERFDADLPTLAWICFHVLQEYARHAGQLDVVVELAGGDLGE